MFKKKQTRVTFEDILNGNFDLEGHLTSRTIKSIAALMGLEAEQDGQSDAHYIYYLVYCPFQKEINRRVCFDYVADSQSIAKSLNKARNEINDLITLKNKLEELGIKKGGK